MSIWDRDVMNGFDRAFDFDGDGKLNSFEQYTQYEFVETEGFSKKMDANSYDDDDFDNDDLDEDGFDD